MGLNLDLDGGLIWLDFHVHKGVKVRASYYKFVSDIELFDEEWDIIRHYALPIGQTILSESIQLFQINEEVVGFSLYHELPAEIDQVNAVSLVWASSKIYDPIKLVPALKTVVTAFDTLINQVSDKQLQAIVDAIISGKGNLDLTLTLESNQELVLSSQSFRQGSSLKTLLGH